MKNIDADINIKENGKEIPVDTKKLKSIIEEVGYWRKANAIHKFFVDKAQGGRDDCRRCYVSIEILKELLDICKQIKEKAVMKDGYVKNGGTYKDGKYEDIYQDGKFIVNKEMCEELLPTASGFFFGSTDYDQWYMEDIEDTIKILEEVIKEDEELKKQKIFCNYYYQSSW